MNMLYADKLEKVRMVKVSVSRVHVLNWNFSCAAAA